MFQNNNLVNEGAKMEEFLDIVDENGEPTGEIVNRDIAHSEGIRHRTSHVWIIKRCKDKVYILLQKRSKIKDSFPECYDISSAGHIPAGSDYEESALRELREELGVEIEKEKLIFCGKRTSCYDANFHGKTFRDRQVFNVYALLLDLDEKDFKLQKEEIDLVKWFEFNECMNAVENHSIDNCIEIEELQMLKDRIFQNIDLFFNPPLNKTNVKELIFEKAKLADIDKISDVYDKLLTYFEERINYVGWVRGLYPTKEDALFGLSEDSLFVARDGEKIAATFILLSKREAGYDQIDWKTIDDYSKIIVLHTFAVNPEYMGCHIGFECMKFMIEYGRSSGMKEIRLDAYEGNKPAIHLYEKAGFKHLATVDLGHGDIGLNDFRLYQYIL